MSELAHAMQALKSLPANYLCLNPAGTWSFVGLVDIRLLYFRRDGQPLTDEDVSAIRCCGAGMLRSRIGTCTWPTREAAVAAAAELGIEVS